MTWQSAGSGDPVTKSNEATAAGSSETFEEFYEREFRAVVGLAYALSGNRSGAEDLAQEAFLVSHRDWDRVGTYARPEIWVCRVVANFSVSVFRSSFRPSAPCGERFQADVREFASLAERRKCASPIVGRERPIGHKGGT